MEATHWRTTLPILGGTLILTTTAGFWLGTLTSTIILLAGLLAATFTIARAHGCPECKKLYARRTLSCERHGIRSRLYTYRCRFCRNNWTRRVTA